MQIVAGSGQLEIKLSSQLNQPRVMGLYDLSEVAGVDVTNRVEELGMIEDVVGFKSKLQPVDSVILVSLANTMSMMLSPGPWNGLRPASPIVPRVATAKSLK